MVKKRTRTKPAGARVTATPTKRERKRDAQREAPGTLDASTPAPAPARAPAEAPGFWFGYEVAWAKLVVARFVMFGLLAIDALLQISHAPRYGAGGFNVAQVPGLDALGPGRASYAIAQLVIAYLFTFAACGVATRLVIPIGTAIYAWLYFGSQLDSYQHHYLVSLVLLLACFVPWQRPADAEPATRIRTWAVRLILVQLGIMYLWAAISKADAAWLDGRTLATQVTGSLRSMIEGSIGFKSAARFALLIEIVLAVTVWIRPAWWLALPLGIAFHLGIIASDLEIGLFAYLMLGFYVLVVPDGVWVWIARTPPVRALGAIARTARTARGLGPWITIAIAIGAGIVLAYQVRLDHALSVALALTAGLLAALALGQLRRPHVAAAVVAATHVLALLLWLAVDRASSVAVDYYRFWGGNARRLGDPGTSERAYRRLVEIAPDEPAGHYQLGRLLLARGDEAAGLASLHEAQRREPHRARAWIAESNYLTSKGRTDEAKEKARAALIVEPTHPGARDLVDRLDGTAPSAPAGAPPPSTDDTESP